MQTTSLLGQPGFDPVEVNRETMAEVLEGLGFLYGAMGYIAAPSAAFGDDDDLAGVEDDIEMEGLGDLGARMPRFKASWLKKRYVPANRTWRKRFNQAGTNVSEKCPGGRAVEFATERGRSRWLCPEPKGGQPYQVWNSKGSRWDARLLHCPATSGYGMNASVECRTIRKRSVFKKIAKGIEKGAKKVGKVAIAPYKIIGKLTLQVLMKAAIPLAKVICKVPVNLIQVGALAAGMDITDATQKRELFCKAVKVKKFSDIRKFFPDMLKIAIKVSATTSIPGLGPALMVAKRIPGLSKILSFAGPGGVGDADPVELLDSLSYGEMAAGLAGISDDELAEGLGLWGSDDTVQALTLVGLLAVAGGALYAATRGR